MARSFIVPSVFILPLLLAAAASVGSFQLIPTILPDLLPGEPDQPAFNPREEPPIHVGPIDVPGIGDGEPDLPAFNRKKPLIEVGPIDVPGIGVGEPDQPGLNPKREPLINVGPIDVPGIGAGEPEAPIIRKKGPFDNTDPVNAPGDVPKEPEAPATADPLNWPGAIFGKPKAPDNEEAAAYYNAVGGGRWEMFKQNAGVSAMHLVINHENKAVLFDSTIYNPSELKLPQGVPCRPIPGAQHGEVDCWAHAAEMDVMTGDIHPLKVMTDPWCSSGGFAPDGTLIQTGGWRDGGRAVRYLETCRTCDFVEHPQDLSGERWYATQQILPDGSFVVIGGRAMFSYEYVPPPGIGNPTNIDLPFLQETSDKLENNLYPFAHLAPDGNIFLFANDRAILFDPKTAKVVRKYPPLRGGSRNYPSSGMSVLLPIDLNALPEGAPIPAEVMVCGGSVPHAADLAPKNEFPPALKTCARISITKPNDLWQMEDMPIPRTIGDMLLLPNGEVLLINGASRGCAGWDFARDPVLSPVLYRPFLDPGPKRFSILRPSAVPRMYHSTSAVLQDASILVAGSNTNAKYFLNGVMFPTEVRVEKFYPPYFDGPTVNQPTIVAYTVPKVAVHGQKFELQLTMENHAVTALEKDVMVTMYPPPFTTHGFSMNQRLVMLRMEQFNAQQGARVHVTVTMPPSGEVAPPGYYMLFAVYKGVPSKAAWVKLQ